MLTKTIEERLDTYGRPACLICGQPKDRGYVDQVQRESIFAGERYQLTCRNHPGHPLHFLHAPEPAPVTPQSAPVRAEVGA